jgi:hypothetical protein
MYWTFFVCLAVLLLKKSEKHNSMLKPEGKILEILNIWLVFPANQCGARVQVSSPDSGLVLHTLPTQTCHG